MTYNSDPDLLITRTTLLDDVLFVESIAPVGQDDINYLIKLYGVAPITMHEIVPGRFKPLPQHVRKPLLHWLTEEYNIFTLGRFGAWTFKVTNDVWEDTEFISRLIYSKQQAFKYKGE